MNLHFIEASHGGGGNWGKFGIGRFSEEEWAAQSSLPELRHRRATGLIMGRGWIPVHILFLDLQTGEGCILRPGGSARADLNKHKIWICPLAEPFLEWLYQQDLSDLAKLPSYIELPDAEFSMAGYRRPGLIELEEGWQHVGCPTCGHVDTFPTERLASEGAPWCPHNHSTIVFNRPHTSEKWTQMVPVSVTSASSD